MTDHETARSAQAGAAEAAIWQQRYRDGRTGWDRGGASPALLRWLDAGSLPPPPARVLVPGCGRGHEVLELARRGYAVTALDFAPAALDALRSALAAAGLDAQLIQADVLGWQAPQPFDAIYEQTCLCALDPAQWPAYAAQLAAWLRPGGQLLALFMQTGRDGGPPFHCALAQMYTLFPAAQWRWPAQAMEVPHPGGGMELGHVLQRQA